MGRGRWPEVGHRPSRCVLYCVFRPGSRANGFVIGAPGSQNGYVSISPLMRILFSPRRSSYDNSGHRIPYPTWQTSEDNIVRTEKVLEQIAGLFAGNSSVATVIAPLNE